MIRAATIGFKVVNIVAKNEEKIIRKSTLQGFFSSKPKNTFSQLKMQKNTN